MTLTLLMAATVILACVWFNKISARLGIPTLLAFIVLGMLFGCDGIVRIPFDNYAFAGDVCSIALIFIMFYGGFGTKWSEARPIAGKAVLLSSVGTVLTAGLVGVFCHYALGVAWLESLLIGSVISSTDAASMFSILRSRRLGLKEHTVSLLEVESGSNDPFSYMLTVLVLTLMNGGDVGSFGWMLLKQVGFGLLFGVVTAVAALLILKRFPIKAEGFDAVFMVAVALVAYAVPTLLGGNGYLSVYLTGILLGNRRLANKQRLVHFFDGATGLMQMLLFFLLGLLATPSLIPQIAGTGLAVALFLTFVARPVAVFALLAPLRCPLNQMLLVSWAGMRGAASIVFAIMAVIDPAAMANDVLHITFFIVLFSILLQGTLLPVLAKRLKMTDASSDVMKTFNDYSDELPVQFIQFTVLPGHPWEGRLVSEIVLPPESLLVLLTRGREKVVPNGKTTLMAGDQLVMSGRAGADAKGVSLYEARMDKGHRWIGGTLDSIPSGEQLVILIRRRGSVLIPRGDTMIMEDDTLVINDPGGIGG